MARPLPYNLSAAVAPELQARLCRSPGNARQLAEDLGFRVFGAAACSEEVLIRAFCLNALDSGSFYVEMVVLVSCAASCPCFGWVRITVDGQRVSIGSTLCFIYFINIILFYFIDLCCASGCAAHAACSVRCT